MPAKPKAEFRLTFFSVVGQAPFPLDMLRYDSCCPDATEDALKIGDATILVGKTEYTITLRRYSPDATPPNAARWKSFGWRVVE